MHAQRAAQDIQLLAIVEIFILAARVQTIQRLLNCAAGWLYARRLGAFTCDFERSGRFQSTESGRREKALPLRVAAP